MKISIQWLLSALLLSGSCFAMDSPENSTGTAPTQSSQSYGSYDGTPPTEPYSLESFGSGIGQSLSLQSIGDSASLSAGESGKLDPIHEILKGSKLLTKKAF